MKVQTSYVVGGIRIERTRARRIFLQADNENAEKMNFVVKCPVPKKFQWEYLLGTVPMESLRTHASESTRQRGLTDFLFRAIHGRSQVMPTNRDPKKRRSNK